MNKKQNAAKKYLSQAFGLNQRIESKIDQIAVLNDLATKATVTYSDMPKSPNRDGSRMEDAIIKIVDLEWSIHSVNGALNVELSWRPRKCIISFH